MLVKEHEVFTQPEKAFTYEWLETNGLGGWAGSTITGAHTRRYHGLLVAATHPPAERMLLLSKLEEVIILNDQRIELGTSIYQGDVIHPQGYQYIQCFTKALFPQWTYEVQDMVLQKTIAMVQGENTTLVIYEVVKAPYAFTLCLLPLITARGYHQLSHASEAMHWDVDINADNFHNRPDGIHDVFIQVPNANYIQHPQWYYQFLYKEERARGLDDHEDLFNHGEFNVSLKEGDRFGIIISTQPTEGRNALALFDAEHQRKHALIEKEKDEFVQQLMLAADQFIVQRDNDLKTVIAGYHWFTDWSRDTMISLTGLCLTTGRFHDARKILAAFAASISEGMLPNRFLENEQPPEYNNADGTLWYFIAIHEYLQATGDHDFVLTKLLPVLKDIVQWHEQGTRYHIHITKEGLLYAGEPGLQLTWMDAKVGNWVVTPRRGKPVELQALWYNAQCITATLLQLNKEEDAGKAWLQRAALTKERFINAYWYEAGGYLLDNINEANEPDTSLRPNQLLALSLPYSLVDIKQHVTSILDHITTQLYTPVGLRTLSPHHPEYHPEYSGDQWHRDAAYHQGTVWC